MNSEEESPEMCSILSILGNIVSKKDDFCLDFVKRL